MFTADILTTIGCIGALVWVTSLIAFLAMAHEIQNKKVLSVTLAVCVFSGCAYFATLFC